MQRKPWSMLMLVAAGLALLPLVDGVRGADEKAAPKAEAAKGEKPADKTANKDTDKPLGPDAAGLFARLDANADGQVSLPEAGSENATLFSRLLRIADKNKDNLLSKAEFTAGLNQTETPTEVSVGRGGPMGPGGFMPDADMVFRRLDANRDGKLTADEAPEGKGLSMALPRFDKNGDKALSPEEFKAMFDDRAGKGPPPGAPGGGEMLKKLMEQDKNGDGKFSKEELPERLRDRFDRLDANNDGAVDRAELLRGLGDNPKKGDLKKSEKKKEK
jgi:hypothetical protein